jgi:hypothetical protein
VEDASRDSAEHAADPADHRSVGFQQVGCHQIGFGPVKAAMNEALTVRGRQPAG